MRIEFAPYFFKRLIHAAAGRGRAHDLRDWDLGGMSIIGCQAVTHVTFRHDAHQAATFFVLYDGSTTAAGFVHRLSSVLHRILRRAARMHVNRFHLVITTTHFDISLVLN